MINHSQHHAFSARMPLLAMLLLGAIAVYAQPPDTISLDPKNPGIVMSNYPTVLGTKYVLEVVGRISYWRTTMPLGGGDADAGYVHFIPPINGFTTQQLDSVNAAIAPGQYLPCDSSSCNSVPESFGCNTPPNPHNPYIYLAHELHLDQDFLSVNGAPFCPRNGVDLRFHSYLMGITGNGGKMQFQFHDGDGDYAHNGGSLKAIITRIEPIWTKTLDTMNFGVVAPHDSNSSKRTDSIMNFGSPGFPGCSGAASGLTFHVDSISGDVGTDGFQITGANVGGVVAIQQGYSHEISATFTPAHKRLYRAVVYVAPNDPQKLRDSILLIGTGKGPSVVSENSAIPFSPMRLEIAPNPFATRSFVYLSRDPRDGSAFTIVRLIDMLGREVRTLYHRVANNADIVVELDAAGLPAGTYCCEALTSNGAHISRLFAIRPEAMH